MNAPAKSLLDIDAFPLVQVREMPRELADVERWLEEVEALLAVERDFALVYPPLPQEELKATSRRASAWCCGSRKIASASSSIAGASCSVPTASRTTSPTCSNWRRCCRLSTARR